MKRISIVFSLVFTLSAGIIHAQTIQGPAAGIGNDNPMEYNIAAAPAMPGTARSTEGVELQPSDKLGLVASPNPFTTRTFISCVLPASGKLSLGIRDMFGETVKTFELNVEQEGAQSMELTSDHLRPGIYTAMLVFKTPDNILMKTIRIVCTK